MEYLDIFDEQGNFLRKEKRSIVHEKGYWHNTVHCWLYDKEGNVYFQIRKDKQKLYTTASGHVKAGETIKEAFGREIFEEIGYPVDYEKAEKIEIVKFKLDREEKDGSIFKDRAFANVYACCFEGNVEDLNFDEEEVSGIVKINGKEALEIVREEEGKTKTLKSFKENGHCQVKEKNISFEDFLVNPGEKAIEKYGKVLEFILEKVK